MLLSCLLPSLQAVKVPKPAPEVLVKLRTRDSQGKRLAGCRVTLVPADEPQMDPVPRLRPIVVQSNERGQVHTRVPAGHAWKVYAWKQSPKGPLATGFLSLPEKISDPDLILERVSGRKILALGLNDWRKALPKGLHLSLSAWGLPPVPVPLPAAGSEECELPPVPLTRLVLSVEHEDFGRLDSVGLFLLSRERQLRMGAAPGQDVIRVSLGQPVRLEGETRNDQDRPVVGARIFLVLPGDREVVQPRWVTSNAQGRFRAWFPWRAVARRNGTAPKLLVAAPGYMLELESLLDLCRWITIKTKKRIDPKMFEGLDMARHRILRLDRGHRLDWSVRGHKPTDRFCLRVQLPAYAHKGKPSPSFVLRVQPDARGRLPLPGDLLVQDPQDALPAFLRTQQQAPPLELHVVHKTSSETLFSRTSGEALPRQRVFELGKRKPVVFEVQVGGRPVGDAKIQIVNEGAGLGLLSPPRQVGISGDYLRPMALGDHWVLAQSQRRGQALAKIHVGAKSPDKIVLTLEPWQRIRVLTSHPNPAQAVLPLHYIVHFGFDGTLPGFVQNLLTANRLGHRGTFAKLKKAYVFTVSPYATKMGIVLAESPTAPRGPGRRNNRFRRGSGTLKLPLATPSALEIRWR